MVKKFLTPGILKMEVIWNKSYDVKISIHDFTDKIVLFALDYVVDVFIWPKFANSNISISEVILTSFLWELDQNNFI